MMLNLRQEERIAALLGALGRDVSATILADLPQDANFRVRRLLDQFEEAPLSEAELEVVLEEFTRFFRFAVDEIQKGDGKSGSTTRGPGVATQEVVAPSTADEAPPFTRTDDPFADLERLQPFQIAGALKDENPRTIALVLNRLAPAQAGAALQRLPELVRSRVFLVLRDPPRAPAGLIERIVRTTVEKGCQLAPEAVSDPHQERYRKLAGLLRGMGQRERAQILGMLEEQDADCAEQIRRMLYTFEDLLRISDRSIQRILAETDSASLARALQGTSDELIQRVMDNLSRRARVTLTDELDLLNDLKPEEQEQARQDICEIIGRLDRTGDLGWA